MAVDYYMAPVGKNGELYTSGAQIAGTVTDPFPGRPTFKGGSLFELTAFSFQVEQALNIAPKATSGQATFNQVRVTRTIDKATPQFFYMCAAGINFKYVDFLARKSTSAGSSSSPPTDGVVYLAFGLEDVIIKSIGYSSDSEAPTEILSLEYRVLRIAYSQQNTNGSTNQFQRTSWDQVTNTGTVPATS